ncbi:hypothetical protein TNCV_2604281 [Trichonephila clavipes]|nr:hypothetical protein TNCV_2604281 [Trichonephila clavipes]
MLAYKCVNLRTPVWSLVERCNPSLAVALTIAEACQGPSTLTSALMVSKVGMQSDAWEIAKCLSPSPLSSCYGSSEISTICTWPGGERLSTPESACSKLTGKRPCNNDELNEMNRLKNLSTAITKK